MKKVFLLIASAAVMAACGGPLSPQDKLTVNDAKINEFIAQMTLEEKVNMLHSKTNMSSAGVERLGIADMNYADGPFGIREEGQPNGFMSAGWTLDSATYFPTGSALAATWSEELAYKYGTGMGKEARLRGKDVILGPAPAELAPLEARSNDEPADPALVAEAVALAKDADLVLFFGGTSKSIETEGSDRKDIKLPCGQEELVQALYAANQNLATVLISGGPTDLQVLEPASPAIVQGWWNGTEGGTALSEVLFGDIAPSGKLPFTFPVKLEDSPAYAMGNFPDPNGAGGDLFSLMFRPDVLKMSPEERQAFLASLPKPVSKYTERFYVGYRWYDTKEIAPMYAFGHGLSYVPFSYDNLKATVGKDVVKVTFTLKNEGEMPADEVAQLYVHRLDSQIEWPVKELKAFQRVSLKAGEAKTVTLEIPFKDLRYWNEATGAWDLEHGALNIMVGGASDDIRVNTDVTI